MMDSAAIADLVASLDDAEKTRIPIRQLSLQFPEMTIDDAYAVQRAWTDIKLARAAGCSGRKIGLRPGPCSSRSTITEPDYGATYDDMFFEDGSEIPLARFIAPRVEAELAFVLGQPLRGPGCTVFDVLRATDLVTPALEVLDARVQMNDPGTGHTRTIVDTIADNAARRRRRTGGRAVSP